MASSSEGSNSKDDNKLTLQYTFEVKEHKDKNVFKGRRRSQLTDNNSSNKLITVMSFENFYQSRSLMNATEGCPSTFKPYLRFLYNEGNFAREARVIMACGDDIGTPLRNWLKQSGLQIWDDKNRPGYDYRRVARLVGSAMYTIHKNRRYVGDLLHSIFLKKEEHTIVLSLAQFKGNLSLEEGISMDIEDFQNFIHWVKQSRPSRRNETDLLDFNLFDALFPPEKPTDYLNLLALSYCVCHAPLFWDHEQRFSFASTYWQIRELDRIAFDKTLTFDIGGITQIDDNWRLKLDPDLQKVLKFDYVLFKSKQGLVPFHRTAAIHYNDNASSHKSVCEVDNQLANLFPEALMKAYTELWAKYPYQTELVEILSGGPPGLDYSRYHNLT